VKIAKADLVPADANLLPEYGSFAGLEEACLAFCGQVNARPHRVTRRPPAEMLAGELAGCTRSRPGRSPSRWGSPARWTPFHW
jgi:hypothetical protein